MVFWADEDEDAGMPWGGCDTILASAGAEAVGGGWGKIISNPPWFFELYLSLAEDCDIPKQPGGG